MKQIINFLAVLSLLIGCSSTSENLLMTNVNALSAANRTRSDVLNYLKKVIENNQVIVGQQCSESPNIPADYAKHFKSIYDLTGKYPALLGLDYGYFSNVNMTLNNQYAVEHWKKGGLVTFSWSADNPWKDGYNVRWNSETNKDTIQVRQLLKSAAASQARTNYRNELEKVGAALKELKNAGVIVLWRPLHEVNGSWFWWGVNNTKQPTNQADYQMLWKDMHDTFTNEFGLDNLLWVYSPSAPGTWVPPVDVMFPGEAYVDLVGTDQYSITPDFKDYDVLKKLNKIVVNGEIGPSNEGYGKFDQMAVLNAFKGKAAYFLQWHSWTNAKVGIKDNLNFKEMMNDPAAITLDKMK
ncbi:glycoside hydrolase family 26 protein [Dyadobacter sp. CY345]|uniref:glycosyl hydrolase n=1 Tax=Dyadobacter sp. CY345 TaxID=2909335 RepID=UPI001F1A1610|nr:glycosyl hydrolase [Dyadobacter sp. CY345]MCF2446750.1 glycoside hydrolase family 26 protein [Dyadobacter sp. CY345]